MNKKIFSLIIIAAPLLIILLIALNFRTLKDFYQASTFVMSDELLEIEKSMSLTSFGSRVFRASSPTLTVDGSVILDECHAEELDQSLSIRGCFTEEKIFVYSVHSDELPGFTESTSAHELLHAVWDRYPVSKRDSLKSDLRAVYDSDEEYKKHFESSEDDAFYSEIFARAGTEKSDVPAALRSAFSEVFTDSDKIINFFTSSSEIFNKISSELSRLDSEITSMQSELDQMKSSYESRAAAFSEKVSTFNNCAATPNCFSYNSFYTERAALENERTELSTLLDTINARISAYNSKIEEYNKNVLHGKELQTMTNPKKGLDEIN